MADKANEPMGGGIPENSSGQAEPLSNRNVWAIDVLVEEVTAMFDTKVETSEPNWLNANTVVTFTPAAKEWEDLSMLLPAIGDGDERIEHVTVREVRGEPSVIIVGIVSNAILYDTRDSFGVEDAAMGLDRELTPDDLTPLAADLVSGDEGFTEEAL